MKKSDTSICAAGSAGLPSPQAGPEPQQVEMFAPSPSVKSTPSAKPSSHTTGQECLSTTTLKLSTTKAAATLSPQATPASPSPLPGSRKARQMTATSGRQCLKSLSAKDPLGRFLKTCLVTSRWASTRCYLTWKVKATPQGRLLFRLAPSMPRTDATGSGLWATPRTTDGTGGPRKLEEKGRRVSQSNPDLTSGANLADQVRMWPTPMADDARGGGSMKSNHIKLHQQVKLWPTPQARDWKSGQAERYTNTAHSNDLNDAVKMWPTPNASDNRDRGNLSDPAIQRRIKMGKQVGLTMAVKEDKGGGALSSRWVTRLMGYPDGWLEIGKEEYLELKKKKK